MTSTVYGQYGGYARACPSYSPPGVETSGTEASGTEAWKVVPYGCVGESYDTNVYFVPKSTNPGLKLEDYVTSILTGTRMSGEGEYASGSVDVAGFSQIYVRNPGLNYIGFMGTVSLNLNESIKKLFPNAGLQVFDSARYTPIPPGFVNPVAGSSPSDINNSQNAFAQGVLAYRTNTWSNLFNVVSSYALSPITSLKASYSNSLIRFGSSHVGTSASGLGNLFDTTAHNGTLSGSTQVSEFDTMSITYAHGWIDYHTQPATTFQTNSGLLGWSRTWTPSLKTELAGGVIEVDPGITSWTGNAALIWTIPNHRATLSYARGVFPGFVGTATPLIGNTVSLSATHDLAPDWQLSETASYINSTGATSSTQSGPLKTEFTTYLANVSLYYWLTRVWSTGLAFSYMNYDSQVGATSYQFPRYVITFAIQARLY
jgi:hypothetical protein